MAGWLVDTNVLLRLHDEEPDASQEAIGAVAKLLQRGPVFITPQVVIEFWCAGTRPRDVNGLGWDTETAAARLAGILNRFEMLEDCPAVFDCWLALVQSYGVKGKQVHDARLVAVMKAHGVENLLTFNVDDFSGYAEVKAVHPAGLPDA